MAEATTTDPGDSTATSQELAPVMKTTRARSVTSDVPRRASRPKAAVPMKPEGPTVLTDSTESSARPVNVEIYQGGADRVDGDVVTITQGGATTVTAGSVNIRQGGIANAQASDISVSMGGVALARAERVSVEMGGMGIAFAREAHVTQGVARSLIAKDVHIDQSLVGTALAGRVRFDRPSAIFLLIAGRVEGPVQAMLDWRGAIAFGAAFGVVAGLIRRRR
jgi:hypothetical protein